MVYVPANISMEVRLAVVLYGGSSLAIYMNGVAQELLKLVRATAIEPSPDEMARDCSKPSQRALVADNELKGSEKVYRQLAQILPVGDSDQPGTLRRKFVVDILSGSSAGGINGIFLAKALSNGQKIASLADLWVKEGDIGLLLNDKASLKDIKGLKLAKPIPSLLNGDRMYRKLLDALEGMEEDDRSTPDRRSPYVTELDLFVTATDLPGLPLQMQLRNGVGYEKRHRNTFHYNYSSPEATGRRNNDFHAGNNPFLAFSARCTSSLPFVFEPMRLSHAVKLLPGEVAVNLGAREEEFYKGWERFYPDYLPDAGGLPFPQRAFGDGGSLDNSPFTQPTSELYLRRSDVLVQRNVIYVEPDPAGPIVRLSETPPDAIQNLLQQVVILPRYQTITEDLQRIKERNKTIRRIQEVLESLDPLIALDEKKDFPDPNWGQRGLRGDERLPAYRAYQKLKVDAVSDDLSQLIAQSAGFKPGSDEVMAIRYLVSAWRRVAYPEEKTGGEASTDSAPETQFLMDFDLPYRLRRIVFVQRKVERVFPLNHPALEMLSHTIGWNPSEEQRRPFRGELLRLKCELAEIQANLLTTSYRLSMREGKVAQLVKETKVTSEILNQLLDQPSHDARRTFADGIVGESWPAFKALGDHIGEQLRESFRGPRGATNTWKEVTQSDKSDPEAAIMARRFLNHFYVRFDEYDMLAFPVQFGTEAGESAIVDVMRISPADAAKLKIGPERKVHGLAYGHFGAFFSESWRVNDIMCGQLDAAQILIDSFGPSDKQARKELMRQASAEIVVEALSSLTYGDLAPALQALLSEEDRPRSGYLGTATPT